MASSEPNLEATLAGLTGGMSAGDLRRFTYLVCVFELKRGDVLIKEGEYTESLYIVRDGALRVTVSEGGRPVEVAEITSGQWVGEVSLFDPGPASATVAVLRKTATVLEFSHTELQDFLRTNPAGAVVLMEALAHALADRLVQTSDGAIRDRAGQFVQGEAPPAVEAGWFQKALTVLGQRDA